jgi:hypothetical protein
VRAIHMASPGLSFGVSPGLSFGAPAPNGAVGVSPGLSFGAPAPNGAVGVAAGLPFGAIQALSLLQLRYRTREVAKPGPAGGLERVN